MIFSFSDFPTELSNEFVYEYLSKDTCKWFQEVTYMCQCFHFCLIRSKSIVANLPDVKTRMETLSESTMDQSALNDLPETDSGMVSL